MNHDQGLNSEKLALETVNHLKQSLRGMVKLDYVLRKERISKLNQYSLNIFSWCSAIAFMIRRISALCLGSTDEDFEVQDVQIKFLRKGEIQNGK